MTSSTDDPKQEPLGDRQARQERAQRAAAGLSPRLEAPGDPEQLAQRIATAHRVDGAHA